MVLIQELLLGLSFCLTSVVARPSPQFQKESNATASAPKHFSVQGVKSSNLPARNALSGPEALKAAFDRAKYQISRAGSKTKRSPQAAQSGAAVANPDAANNIFVIPMTIGGQQTSVLFDTGSSETWLADPTSQAAQTPGHNLYDSSKSTTFAEIPGETFQILYASGETISGNVGTDAVTIGGASVPQQAFGVATSVSNAYAVDPVVDGSLGLAFSNHESFTPTAEKNWFENIQASLATPLFTIALQHNAPGSFEFGIVDASKYTGNLAYSPVDSTLGYWTFTSLGTSIGGQTIDANLPTFADTGNSYTLLGSNTVNAYYAQVPGAITIPDSINGLGGWAFPCNAQMPDLSIIVGDDVTVTVAGANFVFAPLGDGNCFGSLQANNGLTFRGEAMQVWGESVFESVFTVFDASAPRIGFAQQPAAPITN